MEFCPPPHLSKQQFYELQSSLRKVIASEGLPRWRAGHTPSIEIARSFFILNRSSFSGATLSGGMGSGDRFTANAINKLLKIDMSGLEVRYGDYWDALFYRKRRRFRFDAIYADPPYLLPVSKLYGNNGSTHESFDHLLFGERMNRIAKRDRVPIVISYNDCPGVRGMFPGWHFRPISWSYGMNASKKSNEILITNF